MKILLADDSPDAVDILGMLLESYGHEVRTELNGRDAVAAAAEFKPDAVVLDYDMPFMNGAQAAAALRDELGSDLVTVCVSGKACTASERRAFDHFLAKPYDIVDVLAAVEPSASRRGH